MFAHVLSNRERDEWEDHIVDGCIVVVLTDLLEGWNIERLADSVILLSNDLEILGFYNIDICRPDEETQERIGQRERLQQVQDELFEAVDGGSGLNVHIGRVVIL